MFFYIFEKFCRNMIKEMFLEKKKTQFFYRLVLHDILQNADQ